MPGIHRNPTIAFRVDGWQRELIDQRATLSGMLKCDFIASSCIYSNIVVTGTKENIDRIVDAARNLRSSMSFIAGQYLSGNYSMPKEAYAEMELEFLALVVTIVDILDGASYLYGL
ncbi:MAG: hypothetical protein K6G30_01375, partial [Acetatifactor sp.]|nr:hypothetical protein [Acetatifactor sp.]